MSGKEKAAIDLAREELAPILERLRKGHDVLPFMEAMIPAQETEFVPMPDGMVDIIAACGDFELPKRGGEPVWLELADEDGRTLQLIVARPAADGELWVLAKARSADASREA
jgi:hypothetical protein